MTAQALVLGIETSCDETGVGIVRGHELLADAVASSVDEHARFGGVVPEVASRAHLEAMVPTIRRALKDHLGARLLSQLPGQARRGHRQHERVALDRARDPAGRSALVQDLVGLMGAAGASGAGG